MDAFEEIAKGRRLVFAGDDDGLLVRAKTAAAKVREAYEKRLAADQAIDTLHSLGVPVVAGEVVEAVTPAPVAAAGEMQAAVTAVSGDPASAAGAADLSNQSTCSDVGLARRLARQIRGRLAYVRERRAWLGFDGRRWSDRADHMAAEEAKRLHNDLWRELAELKDAERKAALPFVQSTGTKKTIDAMVALASTEAGINVSQSDFDTHPWLLNVENGVLDLRSGELLPHDPALHITQLAPVTYDPDAKSELWRRFISDVTRGDDEIANFLQQAFGLALTGDVSDEVLICHNGGGCNGKSTALEAVAAMLGDYAAVAPPGLFTARNFDAHPTEIAALYGKRFVTAIEQEANRALRESLVKSLTGGDTIRTRRMREDFWEMKPTWKIHIAYNRAPRLTGTDDGIRRRLRVVPWAASFKDRPDPTIKQRLTGDSERSGILEWCLEGLRRRLALGRLESPPAVLVATDEYIDDEDLIGRFIADRCIEGPRHEAEIRSTLAAFRAWMAEDGAPRHVIDGYTANALGRELARRGFGKRRPDSGPYRKRVVYVGLSVASPVEYAQPGEEWSDPFQR
jgi:putative DNA primase/helicase